MGASSRAIGVGVAVGLVLAGVCGCGGDDAERTGDGAGGNGAGGSGIGGVTTAPPDVEASGCDLPTPPDLGDLTVQTVGDGTAASCNESALQAALDARGKIEFDCGTDPVSIQVTATLVVADGTHLDGAGLVTLDGGDEVRILRTEMRSNVIIEGMTFENGHSRVVADDVEADGSGGAIQRGWASDLFVEDCVFRNNVADGDEGFTGGAIFAGSAGWLTIVGCTFEGNSAPSGGATHTIHTDLTVVDSVFHGNLATDGDGAAVYTDGGYVPEGGEHGTADGRISLCGCRFTENVATRSAAAAFLFSYGEDQVVINRTEFRANRVTTADPGLGGAIRIDAIAFVYNSLFVENDCAGQGGALWMGRGPAVFENDTFFANHATLWGGAISYADEPITLTNCTVARNTAGEGSDGLFGGEGATPEAFNTIFYENGASGDGRHCRRPISGANNLAFPATDSDTCGADLIHEDPVLDADLADAGGFTRTLALAPASPALGAGTECPATDQRGEPRDSASCDLGAYELQQ